MSGEQRGSDEGPESLARASLSRLMPRRDLARASERANESNRIEPLSETRINAVVYQSVPKISWAEFLFETEWNIFITNVHKAIIIRLEICIMYICD